MKPILHSKPWVTETDMKAVSDVLNTGMLAQGEITKEFERAIVGWVEVENDGVAVGSGSAAILLALKALNVGAGDEVILPTYVCSTVLEVVLTSGAKPALCDVGGDWIVTSENVRGLVTKNTKAMIIPHMYGILADVASFRQFGIPIIENCAQAIDYRGRRRIYGDIAIYSFHPTKCLTTGEGGMAVSHDSCLTDSMRTIRDGPQEADSHRLFSPMSDISAALGLSQLSRYEQALDRRRYLAQGYESALGNVKAGSLEFADPERSMFFRFPVKIPGGLDLYQDLFAERNVCVRRGVDKLLHRLMDMPDEKFEMSVSLFNTTVSLPIYPALTDEEHSRCIEAAVDIFSRSNSSVRT